MQLYVLPGACSLASHIALEVAAERVPTAMPSWEVILLQRDRNRDPEYAAVNPLGTVPALITSSGSLIVESMAVLLHIVEAIPEARLAPPAGGADRDRVHSLLSVMVTAGHTAFQMLWRSEHFADTDAGRASVQRMCKLRLGTLFEHLEQQIGGADYLVGDFLTVADMSTLRALPLGPSPGTSDEQLSAAVEVHQTHGRLRCRRAGHGPRRHRVVRARDRPRLVTLVFIRGSGVPNALCSAMNKLTSPLPTALLLLRQLRMTEDRGGVERRC